MLWSKCCKSKPHSGCQNHFIYTDCDQDKIQKAVFPSLFEDEQFQKMYIKIILNTVKIRPYKQNQISLVLTGYFDTEIVTAL